MSRPTREAARGPMVALDFGGTYAPGVPERATRTALFLCSGSPDVYRASEEDTMDIEVNGHTHPTWRSAARPIPIIPQGGMRP